YSRLCRRDPTEAIGDGLRRPQYRVLHKGRLTSSPGPRLHPPPCPLRILPRVILLALLRAVAISPALKWTSKRTKEHSIAPSDASFVQSCPLPLVLMARLYP